LRFNLKLKFLEKNKIRKNFDGSAFLLGQQMTTFYFCAGMYPGTAGGAYK